MDVLVKPVNLFFMIHWRLGTWEQIRLLGGKNKPVKIQMSYDKYREK